MSKLTWANEFGEPITELNCGDADEAAAHGAMIARLVPFDELSPDKQREVRRRRLIKYRVRRRRRITRL